MTRKLVRFASDGNPPVNCASLHTRKLQSHRKRFSIAGFAISVWLLWNVRTIRNAYRFRARGPLLLKELSKTSKNINKFLNEYDDSLGQIREEITRAAVKLRS